MNTYKKFCPNVFVAQSDEILEKGDLITVTTKYGKENLHIVHNLVGYTGTKENPMRCYSITREDGFNSQERAKNKIERLESWAQSARQRSNDWYSKSQEGRDFLRLGEPIKIGHHSENRHRALIERNGNRMDNMITEQKKADTYEDRQAYWEKEATKINLSMPESLELFKAQLLDATAYHQNMKDGIVEKAHGYSLAYAKKKVNELQKKVNIAVKLWA